MGVSHHWSQPALARSVPLRGHRHRSPAAQFNLSLSGYEPLSVTLDITPNQTNICRTNLVSSQYVSAMQQARAYLAGSNYEGVVQATGEALKFKPGDADALAMQNESNGHLNEQRQRQDKLTLPKRVFDSLCGEYSDANLFPEHVLKTSRPAKDVAVAIVGALTKTPSAFQILRTASPEPENYEAVVQQSSSLGILGGSERDCLVVVGQTKDDEALIWFKVLEYQVRHTEVVTGLLHVEDRKQLVPVNASRMSMTQDLQLRVQEGIRTVTEKIQSAIN